MTRPDHVRVPLADCIRKHGPFRCPVGYRERVYIDHSFTLGTQDEREAASKQLKGPTPSFSGDKEAFINDVMSALFCSKIVSYAQGFILMRTPSAERPLSHNIRTTSTPARARTLTRKHARDRAHFPQHFRSAHVPCAHTVGMRLFRRGGGRVQVDAELRWDCADVARWVHHPLHLPQEHQGRLRHQPQPQVSPPSAQPAPLPSPLRLCAASQPRHLRDATLPHRIH